LNSPKSMIRMAGKVQEVLENRSIERDRTLQAAVDEILLVSRLVKKQRKAFQCAQFHAWSCSAASVEETIISRVKQLHESASELLNHTRSRSRLPIPSLREMYEELVQLEAEFTAATLDLKAGVISVETEPIELEGIYLGPFRINLSLAKLSRNATPAVFDVEALDPNPAASNSETVHPHVQDGQVCTGDASVPITHALQDGRLADAFLAISSVLHTYNPSSPYIALDDWNGTRCGDCDCLVDERETSICDKCGTTVCEDCSGICDQCQNVFCMSCLEELNESDGTYLCSGCRAKCEECERFAVASEMKEGLCPECVEHHQQQENNHEQSINPSEPGAAACAQEDRTPKAVPASV